MALIGARAHDLGRGNAAFIADAAVLRGAACLQLAPAKALSDCPLPPAQMEGTWARAAAAAFAARGVSVAVLGCYVDICSPDAAARREASGRLTHNLLLARDFGSGVVATETPLSGGEPREALVFLRAALAELLPIAERAGVLLCIEPVWGHAVDSPRVMAELLGDLGSSAFGVILDPVNLVDPGSGAEPAAAALEALERFGGRVAAVHAKDFAMLGGAKVPAVPGEGLMDWERVARAAARIAPVAPFILEEQDAPGFSAGLSLLRSILDTPGGSSPRFS